MISDEIRRLHELHQAGALTLEEFERAKAKVLAGAGPNERINERVSLNKDGGSTGNFDARPTPGVSSFQSLRRSRADRWLGGVCGGLAGTFGLDTWVWRLLFAVLTILTSGFGALVYLLMWIFVPEE